MDFNKAKFSTCDSKEKMRRIATWLGDKKALDLVALDLSSINAVAEGVIIVTASSVRHAQGLADHVLSMCREERFEFLSMEGYQNGIWVLLDFNDILVNIFQEEARTLYRLEELWPKAASLANVKA